MGRAPCCSKVGLHRGSWSAKEDTLLTKYIEAHGEGQWKSLPKKAGLLRCGKSCRLRWMNYLRPGIKRGNITPEEDDLIIRLHSLLGNRWSLIAGRLPGRTDNEIKNYWHTHLTKRLLNNTGFINEPNMHKKVSKLGQGTRKRNSTTTNNSSKTKPQMNIKAGIADGEMTKSKIYHPKPIRVSSFIFTMNNTSFDNAVSGSSSHEQVDKGVVNTQVSNLPLSWSELNDGGDHEGLQVSDEDHDLISLRDLSLQRLVPTNDNMLEKLYDEYLQLL